MRNVFTPDVLRQDLRVTFSGIQADGIPLYADHRDALSRPRRCLIFS